MNQGKTLQWLILLQRCTIACFQEVISIIELAHR